MDNRTVEERFWARVDACSDLTQCWPWTGGRDKDGYGKIKIKYRDYRAHVYAWARERGPVPAGLFVCHRCDHPWCCNAEHLFLGTAADNTADRVAKGRPGGARGEDHGHARLTWEQVRAIRALAGAATQQQIADNFGVRQGTVSIILSRKAWREAA